MVMSVMNGICWGLDCDDEKNGNLRQGLVIIKTCYGVSLCMFPSLLPYMVTHRGWQQGTCTKIGIIGLDL